MHRLIPQLLLLVLLNSTLLVAQVETTGNLRGLVTDSTSGEALAYGNVFIKELNIGASTDSRGYFMIGSVPANRNLTLVISYLGYKTKQIPIKITPNKVTHYDVSLIPTGVELQTIEKIGEKVYEKNDTDISLQRIVVRDLEALPKGVETDIFRSIQYLPGVQSTGDVSARFYVRGGASNQNLVLVDGITIYNPFHALGLFSVVDPDMINNLEFYKGGFSADFGGRLSSVMSINTKDGNKNKLGAKATLSFLTGKALLEGPIPNGSFIITGRKSYSNQILKKFLNEKNVPVDFFDLSFKANYSNPDFIQGGKFIINGFISGDNILNSDPRVEDFSWSNNLFGFKWFQVGDSPLFYELGFSYSGFHGKVLPKSSNVRNRDNQVEDVSVQMDFTYMFDNKDEIGVGFLIKELNTKLFLENAQGLPINLGKSGTNIIFYTKYKFLQWESLGLDAGLRYNLANLSGNPNTIFMEPRVNFTLRLNSLISIKGAWGIYKQELTTITNENEVISIFEPWIIIPDYMIPSKSTHLIGGLKFDFSENFAIDIEGYLKKTIDVPILNQEKTFPSQPDFVSTDAESYGLEFFSRLSSGIFKFTTSYSYAHSYRKLNNLLYYPKYDVRHSLNLTMEIDFGNGWLFNTAWIYNSGLPFTKIVGYYDKYYFEDFFAGWFENDARRPYSILGIQNLGRLPHYHRLDINLSKKFFIYDYNVDVDFSIINLYDRKNIFYFKRDTGERVNMLPVLPTLTIKFSL
ncbi:MAG TPA: TonB-dependent receptor [Melioribacteraceae bacterium]|nr:TonB-dependent receptor [Melioribacteraceae bacterium]